jgi:hypothetical protein
MFSGISGEGVPLITVWLEVIVLPGELASDSLGNETFAMSSVIKAVVNWRGSDKLWKELLWWVF